LKAKECIFLEYGFPPSLTVCAYFVSLSFSRGNDGDGDFCIFLLFFIFNIFGFSFWIPVCAGMTEWGAYTLFQKLAVLE
jgi:hypothetical protein